MNMTGAKEFYRKNYKMLMLVPIILFLVNAAILFTNYQKTGNIVDMDIDFQGGGIATLNWDKPVDITAKEKEISKEVGSGIDIRLLTDYTGRPVAVAFQADKDVSTETLRNGISKVMGVELTNDNYSLREVGPSMGAAFLDNAKTVILVGFILTGAVLIFTFKIPEIAAGAVLCGFLNILAGLAAMDVLGLKLNAGTLAALLMFLASSIDDNILIISRILEHKKHAVDNAAIAAQTGGMMILVSFIAFLVLRLTTSIQLFVDFTTVLLVGLVADTINTWLQNTGLVLWYVERKFGKGAL